ncbi:MAG: glycoside hydrolase family 3 C-terminal domain-containing protein, partial [Clostridia bacterium]|nr:glycoside hydrolase family 3 C-terminal domain-containing protein [Clostridia bacterium]
MNLKAAFVKVFNALSQSENSGVTKDRTVTEGMPELIRKAAAEGAVLLKNDGTLPFSKNSTVSLFGRVQNDWFYTGYGSGGDVVKPYAINLIEGMRNCENLKLNESLAAAYEKWCKENPIDHGVWGHWPRFYPEMPIDTSAVKNAAENSECAVLVIGRSSGEDRENVLEKGSYYMTDDELSLITKVTDSFSKTVIVFNIGCMMDFGWMESFGDKISAALIVWQGGMESGNAVCDLLSGKATPSGKLAATAVKKYEYYPCANDFGAKEYNNYVEDIYVGYRYFETFRQNEVLYPFGHGLSYTKFEKSFVSAEGTDDGFSFRYKVKNVGDFNGALAIQVYVEKPCGVLGNPYRELAGFNKTKILAVGEEEELTIDVPMRSLASYDESGKTGFASAYVIEKGTYGFAIGEDVRSAETVYTYENAENALFEQLTQVAAPKYAFSKIKAEKGENGYEIKKEAAFTSRTDLRKIIKDNLPEDIRQTGDKGIKLIDVKNGKATMEDFVAQLSIKELEAITRGD